MLLVFDLFGKTDSSRYVCFLVTFWTNSKSASFLISIMLYHAASEFFFCIFKISFINWLTRPPSQLLLKFATTFFSDLFLERIVAKLADMWEELNSLLKSICMCFWAHAKKIPSDSAKFINLDMPRIYQKQKKNTRGGGGAEPLLARKKQLPFFNFFFFCCILVVWSSIWL